jgi:hypothetical protein
LWTSFGEILIIRPFDEGKNAEVEQLDAQVVHHSKPFWVKSIDILLQDLIKSDLVSIELDAEPV